MTNLIKNFNFQAPYHFPPEGQEDVRIVRGMELIPFRSMNLHVPTDFLCFTCDDGKYVTVEMGKGETSERLFNGHTSVKYFVAGQPHDAGLAQTLQLEAGTYQYRAWVHGWSNHNIPVSDEYKACNNDGLCSSGVGWGPYFELEGTIGERNGVPWNDAKFNMLWSLGVTMGEFVSPHSDHVKWGVGAYVYNIFHELPLMEFVVEKAGLVTVYVRSITEWQFRNADGYIGEMELVRVGDAGKCKGEPRVQYPRTYVLTPPGMVLTDQQKLRAIFPDYTIGPSADDAGLGALDDKTVIAVDPYKWANSLQDFFAQYYPGTIYKEYILNPGQPSNLLFWQCDPRWKDEKLAGYACTQTLCQTGCWISDCASAMVKLGIDANATPHTVNQALGENGFTGCLTNWSAMESKLQLHVEKSTTNEYEASLWLDGQPDHCAFAEVQPGAAMHFIFVEKYDDDNGFYCHDPYRNVSAELYSLYPGGAESWRLIRKAGSTPPPPPSPRLTRGHIGLHLQTMVSGWEKYYRDVQPPIGKVLASMQDVLGIKRASINTTAVWRRVDDDQGPYLEAEDPMVGARKWVDTFRDSLYQVCDQLVREMPTIKAPYFYVESINETYPSLNMDSVVRARNFDMAFIDALAECNLPIAPAVFTAAIGNPHESEYAALVPLARKCEQAGGMMGYHNYWYVKDSVSTLAPGWEYYAGRWAEMDEVFVANGVHVRWYGGESGAYESVEMGWKNPVCFNGNWAAYLSDIRDIDQYLAEWNLIHGDRYLGLVLFTSGEATGWQWFQIRDLEIADMQTFLLQRYG